MPDYGAPRSGRGGRERSVLLPKMSESEPPDRLARLDERLRRARARDSGEPKPDSGNAALQQGMAAGLRIGVELVVAIVVATGLGWAIDRIRGTMWDAPARPEGWAGSPQPRGTQGGAAS